MSAQDASQKMLVVLAAEASTIVSGVEVTPVVERTLSGDITITEVDIKETKSEVRDGKVPWSTAILPELRGKEVSVSMLHWSIEKAYGEGVISRMRVYKWLRLCVVKELAIETVMGYKFND